LNRKQVLFIAKFVALLVAFYLFLSWRPIDEGIVSPFTRGIANVAAALLRLGDPAVAARGTALTSGAFAVEVKNGCNGVEATLLLVSAVLAFPAAWRKRVIGIVAGIVLIQAVNMIRVVSLFILARDFPKWFDTFHVTIWQSVMFLLAIGFFILWSSKFGARQPQPVQ
jgi:exosortase H (IPTLxxWG-CTERM-specific)